MKPTRCIDPVVRYCQGANMAMYRIPIGLKREKTWMGVVLNLVVRMGQKTHSLQRKSLQSLTDGLTNGMGCRRESQRIN